MDEYLDKVVDKEEETPQAGLASAQDWGSSATPSKVGLRGEWGDPLVILLSWQEKQGDQI